MLVFEEREKTRVPGEKPLGAEKRTNNKLKPHMMPDPRVFNKGRRPAKFAVYLA